MPADPRPSMPFLRITPGDARKVAIEPGHLSALLATHGSLEVRWFAPDPAKPQTPHDRDEIYVVASGSCEVWRAGVSAPFAEDSSLSVAGEDRITVHPGDVIFVPAGTEHQFEAMSSDFGTWMIFYGPEGGEAVMP